MTGFRGGMRRWSALLVSGLLLAAVLLVPMHARAAGGLLPDLVPLPPEDLQMQVDGAGRRLLRFTQSFTNLGKGFLQVRGVKQPDGSVKGYQDTLDQDGQVVATRNVNEMVWHPEHGHWHIARVAGYTLRQGSPYGPVLADNGKVSFCLRDSRRLEGGSVTPGPRTYPTCDTLQFGITPGWVDVYPWNVWDQWVDVTAIPDSIYYLVVQGDPNGVFADADKRNNLVWRKVELLAGGRQVRTLQPDEALIRLGGERLDFPVYPRTLEDGTVMAHVRLAERLGAKVAWDGRVIITATGKQIIITPGEAYAQVNAGIAHMGAPAIMTENRVLVPAAFLAEQLGASSAWNARQWTLDIAQ